MPVQLIIYALFVLSFIQGCFSVHPMFVIPLALVTALLTVSKRRNSGNANNINTLGHEPGKLTDGAFLFVLHCLIHFPLFALGYFIVFSGKF